MSVYVGIVIFILGAVLGSFYYVVGTRMPKGEKVVFERSHCDHCHKTLKWYELIPIFSYTFQLGKCNNCHKRISIGHFLIEVVTPLLFLGGYFYYGLTIKYYIYLVIISLAIIIFVSDFKYMVILDEPIIVASGVLIILKFLEIGPYYTLYAVIYGLVMFILMYFIQVLGSKLFKRESLGGGDVKLAFIIGLTLGYPGVGLRLSLVALIFSAFLALPYAFGQIYLNKNNELPYGPFLISAMIIVFIFIEKFTNILVFFTLG